MDFNQSDSSDTLLEFTRPLIPELQVSYTVDYGDECVVYEASYIFSNEACKLNQVVMFLMFGLCFRSNMPVVTVSCRGWRMELEVCKLVKGTKDI